MLLYLVLFFFFSSRRRHTRCALVTGVQTCALPISLPLAAVLPGRRALTDRLILPLMTGSAGPVTDRVERFRLTAAFKERHPGGMGDLMAWLVLPPGLPPGPLLFDGLRSEENKHELQAPMRHAYAVFSLNKKQSIPVHTQRHIHLA